jgi:integrase/recombinase XerD
MTALAPVLQAFFTQHLAQRRASPHTIASYRDCFRLLLRFAQARTGKQPATLELADLDTELIGVPEPSRGRSSQRDRDPQPAAVRDPLDVHLRPGPLPRAGGGDQTGARDPAQTPERHDRELPHPGETGALLNAPDQGTPIGRRDHALLLTAIQTGLRVSELAALRCRDLTFGTGANVYAIGKGRRDRHTPLTPATAGLLRAWLHERRVEPEDPVFATRTGGRLSTDAVEDLVDKHVAAASTTCPSLQTKRVTPHTLRHTCAMNLLAAGVDLATIALFLGHSSTRATEIYIHADLELKEKALARIAPTPTAARRYRPPDKLLAFLESL